MSKRISILLVVFVLLFLVSKAEWPDSAIEYPVVGQLCPQFTLRNVMHDGHSVQTLADIRKNNPGKWLVFNFWTMQCGTCIKSFPTFDQFQKDFKEVKVFLVGNDKKEKDGDNALPTYESWRELKNMVIPSAFDSLIFDRFNIEQGPYILLIDPAGIVRATTNVLSRSAIKAFLKGQEPLFAVKEVDPDRQVTRGNFNGYDTDFVFRSALSKFKLDMQFITYGHMSDAFNDDNKFQVAGQPLSNLYYYAFFGVPYISGQDTFLYSRIYPKAVLSLKDSSIFMEDDINFSNCFCYSIVLPKSMCAATRVQKIMQTDLNSYFGLKASVVDREVSIFKLTATEGARQRLKTKGGQESLSGVPGASYSANNMRFYYALVRKLQLSFIDKVIILDETGINFNVDLSMNCDLSDWKAVNKELNRNGLKLVKSTKMMKVLLIEDED